MKYGDPEVPPSKSVTSDHMRRFNKLVDFAKSKGYAGKVELDHDPLLRKRVFAEYNASNPKDTISEDMVQPIQSEIQNYKQKALSAIQSNKGLMDKGTTSANFMKNISKVDNIFGQYTSQFKFPEAYILDKNTGEKKSIGFAPKVDLLAALNK